MVTPDSLNLQVKEGARMNLSVLTYGGIPSSVWMIPIGLSVKPKEEKVWVIKSEELAHMVHLKYNVKR